MATRTVTLRQVVDHSDSGRSPRQQQRTFTVDRHPDGSTIITSVMPGSALANAGIRPNLFELLLVNQLPVANFDVGQLNTLLASVPELKLTLRSHRQEPSEASDTSDTSDHIIRPLARSARRDATAPAQAYSPSVSDASPISIPNPNPAKGTKRRLPTLPPSPRVGGAAFAAIAPHLRPPLILPRLGVCTSMPIPLRRELWTDPA
jgi:hypothetical protein